MYRPALQQRLRDADTSRPSSAFGRIPQQITSRPQSALSRKSTAELNKSSEFNFESMETQSDAFHGSASALSTFFQPAVSGNMVTSKSMREDAKLVFQQLQSISMSADYTLKFNTATGTCSADMLRDYLLCLEQHVGFLEKPFSIFLQQERHLCKERADVLNCFHEKYLEIVRASLKQLSTACTILRQIGSKNQRNADAAHQENVSASQAQSLLRAKTQELSTAECLFTQKLEAKQIELMTHQSRCIELEKELNEVKALRDQEIAKSKEWYQWELQFAEDKLDQAELKMQLLQEHAQHMRAELLLSMKKEEENRSSGNPSNHSKGTQTFWKTGDISASELKEGSSVIPISQVQRNANTTTQRNDAKDSVTDDDDDDDAIKCRLRKFLTPSAVGDIQAIKKRALVELILDGTLESGSFEYLKAVDTGQALSKAALLRSISEVYATRTLLLQSGETISPYLTHDLGRFTLAHYRQRFGLKKVAEKRAAAVIRAVRVYRSTSNRIDLFGQFCGIDTNLPAKCLDIYIKLLIYIENMPEAPHIENEEATAVCWVPLEKFITACENVIASELDLQDLEDIFGMAEQLAVPNDKKKHVLKINFDKICCSVFSKVIHASQTTSEMCVTDILLNGTEDQTEDSGISRKVFFDILSCSNPNFSKLSSDTLYDEGLKRQHGSLGFQSSDGRLRLSPQYCSDLIREFVLDGAPGHAPSIQLQRARQTVLDALTTFWMRNGKLIETKLRETQITAARLAETMHSFFKGYFQKENTLSLWILTRSMISDLNLGKIIAERTRNPENAAVTKIKSTVQKLMMVRRLRSPGRSATRISCGPGPATTMLHDAFADTDSVFASAVSLHDGDVESANLVGDLSSSNKELNAAAANIQPELEQLTMLPRTFLADPDNADYGDLLLQIYGPDSGQLFA